MLNICGRCKRWLIPFPCLEIQADAHKAYDYTSKGNLVAVITNGTAVLGLGNIGALAWKPVMEGKVRVNVTGYRCRCKDTGHIPFHLSVIDIDLPSIATMQIPLEERTEGENYLSGNKSVSGVRLNHYKLSDDGRYLEIDLSIILYRETKGDIRPFAKFVISILRQNDFL